MCPWLVEDVSAWKTLLRGAALSFHVISILLQSCNVSSFVFRVDLSSSPPGPYGQEMYVYRPEERFKSPPILPPHLLQVILNKDTNISVSTSMLPTDTATLGSERKSCLPGTWAPLGWGLVLGIS